MRWLPVVALVVLVALSGCSITTSESTAGPTLGGETPTAECETDLLLTDDGTEELTPRAMPAPPGNDSGRAAALFARDYESSFAYNHELGDRVESIAVTLQGTSVETVGDGYHVRVHVWIQTTVSGGNTTREAFYDAHYFVSDRVLRRSETARHESPPDPTLRQSGLTLSCESARSP